MEHRIWKALDAPSAFFGIRGRYMSVCLMGATAGLAVVIPVMETWGGAAGIIAAAVVVVADYAAVMSLQTRMTYRQFVRRRACRRLPSYIRMRPVPVSRNLKRKDI